MIFFQTDSELLLIDYKNRLSALCLHYQGFGQWQVHFVAQGLGQYQVHFVSQSGVTTELRTLRDTVRAHDNTRYTS